VGDQVDDGPVLSGRNGNDRPDLDWSR
jgi:hypothetical protein